MHPMCVGGEKNTHRRRRRWGGRGGGGGGAHHTWTTPTTPMTRTRTMMTTTTATRTTTARMMQRKREMRRRFGWTRNKTCVLQTPFGSCHRSGIIFPLVMKWRRRRSRSNTRKRSRGGGGGGGSCRPHGVRKGRRRRRNRYILWPGKVTPMRTITITITTATRIPRMTHAGTNTGGGKVGLPLDLV